MDSPESLAIARLSCMELTENPISGKDATDWVFEASNGYQPLQGPSMNIRHSMVAALFVVGALPALAQEPPPPPPKQPPKPQEVRAKQIEAARICQRVRVLPPGSKERKAAVAECAKARAALLAEMRRVRGGYRVAPRPVVPESGPPTPKVRVQEERQLRMLREQELLNRRIHAQESVESRRAMRMAEQQRLMELRKLQVEERSARARKEVLLRREKEMRARAAREVPDSIEDEFYVRARPRVAPTPRHRMDLRRQQMLQEKKATEQHRMDLRRQQMLQEKKATEQHRMDLRRRQMLQEKKATEQHRMELRRQQMLQEKKATEQLTRDRMRRHYLLSKPGSFDSGVYRKRLGPTPKAGTRDSVLMKRRLMLEERSMRIRSRDSLRQDRLLRFRAIQKLKAEELKKKREARAKSRNTAEI